MRRVFIATGLISVLLMAGLLPAGASTSGSLRALVAQVTGQEEAPAKPEPAGGPRPSRETTKVEPLDLRCAAFEHPKQPGRKGVGCFWSEARHPGFAAYRLSRQDRGGEPAVVFETPDRTQTRYFDEAADPSGVYVVEALDAAGRVIGQSRPTRVRSHHGRTAPESREPDESTTLDMPS